jgi:O-antigen/teichoic acid export membrane protein
VLGAPIGLLARAVLDVFKRHAAQAYRDRGECRQEYVRTFSVLTLGSLATAVVFALTLERLFEVAFGPGWQVAGGMGLWLLPMFALRFIASPLSYMVYIAERQEVDLLWQAALLLATILTLRLSPSVESAVKWYGAAYSALYVLSLWLSFQFSKGRVR